MTPPRLSASSRSASAVEPTTSVNTIVTGRRVPPSPGADVGTPHAGQKRASGGSGDPQVWQLVIGLREPPGSRCDPEHRMKPVMRITVGVRRAAYRRGCLSLGP